MRIRSWREVQRSMHLNRIVSNSTTAIVIDFHYMIRSQTFYRFSSVTTAANTAQRKIRSRSTFNVHHHHQKQEMNRQKRKCVQKNANAKLHNHVDWASGARWKRAHIAKQINTSSTSLLFSEQFSHRMHCSMLPPSLPANGINWIDRDRAWIRRRFAFIYLNVYATISLLCSPFTLSDISCKLVFGFSPSVSLVFPLFLSAASRPPNERISIVAIVSNATWATNDRKIPNKHLHAASQTQKYSIVWINGDRRRPSSIQKHKRQTNSHHSGEY